MNFRTLGIPITALIAGEFLFISLSVWQFQRLDWKNEILEKFHNADTTPITKLDALDLIESNQVYRIVTVTVNIGEQQGMQLVPRTHTIKDRNGMVRSQLGYHLLVPGHIETNLDGYTSKANNNVSWEEPKKKDVMIELGWVDKVDTPLDILQHFPRPITLRAMIMPAHKSGLFTPDNTNQNIYSINPSFLYNHDCYDHCYLRTLGLSTTKLLPLDKPEPPVNRHLSYALTWASLSVVLLLCGLFYIRYLINNNRP